MKVYHSLEKDDMTQARKDLSMIVGRDTQRLDKEGMIRAAVETVAENVSDGVIAPLLFMAIGGPALGFAYKGINTLDSMIGYKNERYMYFGRFAAHLDDVANFIPARLSAWLMLGAVFLLGYDAKNAWKIYKRDKKNHASPNSAHTEAVCAGALGVRLAGDAWYSGRLLKKPFIGDHLRSVQSVDIQKANKILYVTAVLALVVCLGITPWRFL